MIKKKSQSAIEFMILVSFMLFFFVIFLMAINRNLGDKIEERKSLVIKETALEIQNEIDLASRSQDGYYREFEIPDTLNGQDFLITSQNSVLYIEPNDQKYSMAIPIQEVLGNVQKGTNVIKKQGGVVKINLNMALTSSAFDNNKKIPSTYTCDDADSNPPFTISGIPAGTLSLAIIIDDPDTSFFVHWIMWDFLSDIEEGIVPVGAVQGENDFSNVGYNGPCPPLTETHRYVVKVYALDEVLGLSSGSSREDLEAAMDGKILDIAEMSGLYR